ncbi:MAG: zinc ribbon domain-containing protein [Prevotella sp.]|nr:zinc ribbon domain-containing protein [Prevotella sp.]
MSENNNEFASASRVNETPAVLPSKKVFCKYCGNEIQPGTAFCPNCGKPQGNTPAPQNTGSIASQQPNQHPVQQNAFVAGDYQHPQTSNRNTHSSAMSSSTSNSMASTNTTTVVVNGSKSNGMGTAGFILALLALLVSWVPVVDIIVWFLGALFSFIGLFKAPRGLAIAGFIISFIGIIILVTVFGTLVGLAGR